MLPQRVTFDVSYSTFIKAIVIMVVLLFVYVVRDILMMMFVAIIIAAALMPIVNFLERKKIPRWVSVLVIYLLLIGALILIFGTLVPPLLEQIRQLVTVLPEYITVLYGQLQKVSGVIPGVSIENITGVLKSLGDNLGQAAGGVYERIIGIFGGFFSVVVIFVLSFYFVLEEDALKKFIKSITPQKHRLYIEDLVHRIQLQIGKWFRGQLFLGLVVGVFTFVGLELLGVKYALVLALIAGLLEIVPYLGPIVSAIPGVLVALTQSPLLGLLALLVYVVVQQLENHLLVPKVMQKAVGLNPLIVILVILVGAKLAGILGGILAVPAATAIQVFLSDLTSDRQEILDGREQREEEGAEKKPA